MRAPAASLDNAYYVTAPLLWPLVLGLRTLGVDTDAVLARAGLELSALKNPDTRVRATQASALMQGAIEQSGDPDLGLKLWQFYRPGVFSVVDYLAHSSATLREAIERMCRYELLHQNGVRTTLQVQAERAVWRQDLLLKLALPPQIAENSLANMLVIGRQLTGARAAREARQDRQCRRPRAPATTCLSMRKLA